MNDVTKISIFEGNQIRRIFLENKWWFSVIDIIAFLTDSKNPRDYWHKMKIREKNTSEVELSTICRRLKLIAPDGKKRETDCANIKGIFRIIQSIPLRKSVKYNQHLFITVYFLIIAASCGAMENKNKPSIFKEITAVKNPRFVRYLTNERIVIAGEDGCNIVNPIRNEIIKKLNNVDYYHRGDNIPHSGMKVCQNKKKIISFHDHKIVGYNAESGEQEWSTRASYIRSFACDALGETVFVCFQGPGVARYKYGTDDKSWAVNNPHKYFYSITMHPSKKDVCISKNPGEIFLYTFDDSSSTLKKEIVVQDGNVLEYSLDGSCIAVRGTRCIFIIDQNTDNEKYPCINHEEKGDIKGMAFHPNNSTLATISRIVTASINTTRSKITTSVCYWDIKNQELIDTTELSVKNVYDFVLSDDGLQFIAASKDKCVSGSVPFKVRWHNKYPYFLFLLKKYLNQCHHMPDDIIQYLMSYLV